MLYYSDCPHYVQTKWDIESILAERKLNAEVQLVDLARAPDVDREMPFAGSPTILVNGKDIAPAGDHFSGPQKGNCRLYDYKDEVYDYPPKELIREALTKGWREGEEQGTTASQPRERGIIGDGEMPVAPEHDLDYRREPEAPQEEAPQKLHKQARDMNEGPEELDAVVYEIDIIEAEEDKD